MLKLLLSVTSKHLNSQQKQTQHKVKTVTIKNSHTQTNIKIKRQVAYCAATLNGINLKDKL